MSFDWGFGRRCRTGYERELHALLTQLVRDMDRKIERQRERALKESEPRPVSASEQLELDAIKVTSLGCASETVRWRGLRGVRAL